MPARGGYQRYNERAGRDCERVSFLGKNQANGGKRTGGKRHCNNFRKTVDISTKITRMITISKELKKG